MNKPVAWEGSEEWEQLAWELCADEHGEESCTDLIWDMGVIPEPWGDRWQKYEDEAKRMISMVRKCTHPVKVNYEFNSSQVKELTDEEIFSIANKYEENMDDFGNRIGIPKDDYVDFARAILRKAQEK